MGHMNFFFTGSAGNTSWATWGMTSKSKRITKKRQRDNFVYWDEMGVGEVLDAYTDYEDEKFSPNSHSSGTSAESGGDPSAKRSAESVTSISEWSKSDNWWCTWSR